MVSSTTKRRRGKPVVHPPVLDIDTGKIYETFTEAANDIHGDRTSVMRVCEGTQTHNKKHRFRYISEEEIKRFVSYKKKIY